MPRKMLSFDTIFFKKEKEKELQRVRTKVESCTHFLVWCVSSVQLYHLNDLP